MIRIVYNNLKSYMYKFRNSKKIEKNTVKHCYDTDSKKNRITLFMHFSIKEQISKSDWIFLKELSQISDIILISNSPLTKEEKEKIERNRWLLLERENLGFDFGGWKEAIERYKNKILSYDSVSLVNNSCYFPVFPLDTVYKEMESKDLDFWGITGFKENSALGSIEARILNMDSVPTHVQSYFITFNLNRVNDCFFMFWENYKPRETFEETVRYGEVGLSEFLIQHDKKYDVYVKETLTDREYFGSPDISKHQPEILLAMGSPLIKKKSLTLITIRQYYILLEYLKDINPELYTEMRSVDYMHSVSRTYRIMNQIADTCGLLNGIKTKI